MLLLLGNRTLKLRRKRIGQAHEGRGGRFEQTGGLMMLRKEMTG
jgi:hypothetical protein